MFGRRARARRAEALLNSASKVTPIKYSFVDSNGVESLFDSEVELNNFVELERDTSVVNSDRQGVQNAIEKSHDSLDASRQLKLEFDALSERFNRSLPSHNLLTCEAAMSREVEFRKHRKMLSDKASASFYFSAMMLTHEVREVRTELESYYNDARMALKLPAILGFDSESLMHTLVSRQNKLGFLTYEPRGIVEIVNLWSQVKESLKVYENIYYDSFAIDILARVSAQLDIIRKKRDMGYINDPNSYSFLNENADLETIVMLSFYMGKVAPLGRLMNGLIKEHKRSVGFESDVLDHISNNFVGVKNINLDNILSVNAQSVDFNKIKDYGNTRLQHKRVNDVFRGAMSGKLVRKVRSEIYEYHSDVSKALELPMLLRMNSNRLLDALVSRKDSYGELNFIPRSGVEVEKLWDRVKSNLANNVESYYNEDQIEKMNYVRTYLKGYMNVKLPGKVADLHAMEIVVEHLVPNIPEFVILLDNLNKKYKHDYNIDHKRPKLIIESSEIALQTDIDIYVLSGGSSSQGFEGLSESEINDKIEQKIDDLDNMQAYSSRKNNALRDHFDYQDRRKTKDYMDRNSRVKNNYVNPLVNSLTKNSSLEQPANNRSAYLKIIKEFRSYTTDLVKMMEKPVLASLEDIIVKDFYVLCLKIERHEVTIGLTDFEVEWLRVLSHADTQQASHFSKEQSQKFRDSKDLLSKALNEVSTDNEKELSIKALERKLVGVLPVNEALLNNLKRQVGLKEVTS